MHKEVWRYGAAKAVLRMLSGDIAKVDVIGLASAVVIAQLRVELVCGAHAAQAKAVVVDFRRAAVTANLEDLPEMRGEARSRASLPVAYVIEAHDESAFLAHAWAMSRSGLLRAVFTDPDEALAWALARADVTSAWG